ncbi:MFS transporter [Candidatus Kaiserbacteria bacterium]|nr:MFS transporter [Candidatus Kaiserbacteria bacterium]
MTAYPHRWLALGFLVLAQFMIVLDVSILNVALPSIERTFSLDVSSLQWIVTAYTLAFGGFLLLGGRAADLYGRRLVFVCGVIAFTGISFLIGLANSSTLMVPLRALQGLAAAFMSPAALSILLTLFTEPDMRSRALSIWGAVSAGGATAGLLLGGFLTQYMSWRWNFFVNVPVGITVVIAALQLLPAHVAEERTRTLDLPGAILITSGLMLLVYVLSQAHEWGWTALSTISLLALSVLLIIGFVINESRATHPLMPLSIFRLGNVAAADLVQLPITASLFSMFFFLSLYVQNILGYSPLLSGLAFLPSTLTVGLSAILAPRIIHKVGYKALIVIAPLFLASGLFIFAHLPVHGQYVQDILPGILIMAVGLGSAFVSIAIAATAGVPGHESGLASGMLTTAQQLGGSLGLAILASIVAAHGVPAGIPTTDQIATIVDSYHTAFYTGMFFALGASVIALLFIKSVPSNQGH